MVTDSVTPNVPDPFHLQRSIMVALRIQGNLGICDPPRESPRHSGSAVREAATAFVTSGADVYFEDEAHLAFSALFSIVCLLTPCRPSGIFDRRATIYITSLIQYLGTRTQIQYTVITGTIYLSHDRLIRPGLAVQHAIGNQVNWCFC